MKRELLVIYLLVVFMTSIFAQAPMSEKAKKAGLELIEKLSLYIGSDVPPDAIMIGTNTYKIPSGNEGAEGLTEILYTDDRYVIAHGYVNMSQYEEISKTMYVVFHDAFTASIGMAAVIDKGGEIWKYNQGAVVLRSPHIENGLWAVGLCMFEKWN